MNRRTTPEQLEQAIDLLKNTNETQIRIAKTVGIAQKVVSSINLKHKLRRAVARAPRRELNGLEKLGLSLLLKNGHVSDTEIVNAYGVTNRSIDECRGNLKRLTTKRSNISRNIQAKKIRNPRAPQTGNQEKTEKKPSIGKSRGCLKCGGMFYSDGPGNRICRSCRASQRHSPAAMPLHALV